MNFFRRRAFVRREGKVTDKNRIKKSAPIGALFNLKFTLLIARTVETPVPTLIISVLHIQCDFGFTPILFPLKE